jgi:hypothetical protein
VAVAVPVVVGLAAEPWEGLAESAALPHRSVVPKHSAVPVAVAVAVPSVAED